MEKPPQLTRRGLFRGLGTVSLMTGCSAPPKPSPTAPLPASPSSLRLGDTLGPAAEPLRFELNGQQTSVQAPPHRTLLDLLRNQLKLTGTKKVCDRGACGACMVLVDGQAQNSCMMLAHDVADRSVLTVEGLQQNDLLAPLQKEFIAHDALQCGFCTPGMLISCTAFLNHHTSPDIPEETAVRQAIAGNLCRCGTYPHIVKAVQATAQALVKKEVADEVY